MKANREIRAEAWRLLWREKWAVRFLATSLVLTLVLAGVMFGLDAVYRAMGVETLADLQRSKLEMGMSGLDFASPSSNATFRMSLATLFQNFIQQLFSGIAMMGVALLLVKAIRGRKEGWFGDALVGFRTPFAMFWLWFRVQLQMSFWALGALMPVLFVGGVIAALGLPQAVSAAILSVLVVATVAVVLVWVGYRYRLVWLLKAAHPDWGAGVCIRASVAMMAGWKRRALSLDWSYWPWFLLTALAFSPGFALVYLHAAGTLAEFSFGLVLTLVLTTVGGSVLGQLTLWYILLGHAVFFREIPQ